MRNHFFLAGIAALGTGLASCDSCEGVHCAPCDPLVSDAAVYFDLDSLRGGFRKAEINGGYAVRYQRPGFAAPLDTIRQGRFENGFYARPIGLRALPWPSTPTPMVTGLEFADYNYRFVLPAAGRTYDISDIEIKTDGDGEGCCNCGFNVRRRLLLNGVQVVADGDLAIITLRR